MLFLKVILVTLTLCDFNLVFGGDFKFQLFLK